jgi:RNA polymerase sigma-70 factor (ECF subfamily)
VIDALDDLHKALVVLYLEGHDQREMAEILGLTETNVATRLSRLRQRLRHDLAPRPAPSGGDRGTR